MRGDTIYKSLVKSYINKLSIDDLKTFANKNNIEYTSDELILIFNFIKYNYNDLLDGNIKVFSDIKNKINPNLYKKLLDLYIEYKNKYL